VRPRSNADRRRRYRRRFCFSTMGSNRSSRWVYAGLFVCAHNDSVVERAVFSEVTLRH